MRQDEKNQVLTTYVWYRQVGRRQHNGLRLGLEMKSVHMHNTQPSPLLNLILVLDRRVPGVEPRRL